MGCGNRTLSDRGVCAWCVAALLQLVLPFLFHVFAGLPLGTNHQGLQAEAAFGCDQ